MNFSEIYEKSKDKDDGFLYITYSKILSYGASSSSTFGIKNEKEV